MKGKNKDNSCGWAVTGVTELTQRNAESIRKTYLMT